MQEFNRIDLSLTFEIDVLIDLASMGEEWIMIDGNILKLNMNDSVLTSLLQHIGYNYVCTILLLYIWR